MSTPSTYQPPAGYVGNLTEEQTQKLAKFKEELQAAGYYDPAKHDDALLLRFLRARKFDLALAKKMFIEAEDWRKKFGADELYGNFDYPEAAAVSKIYPQFYHKTDVDGRPVYIQCLGGVSLPELEKVTTTDRQLKKLVYEYEKSGKERLPACSRKVGHPVETYCTVLDLNGVGIRSFWSVKDFVQEASGIGQNYYPETMGKFYIINAPWGFSTVWSLVSGWLDPVTVAKIAILGSSAKDFDKLFAQIPKENFPKHLGGSCECAGGCVLSDAGPWKE